MAPDDGGSIWQRVSRLLGLGADEPEPRTTSGTTLFTARKPPSRTDHEPPLFGSSPLDRDATWALEGTPGAPTTPQPPTPQEQEPAPEPTEPAPDQPVATPGREDRLFADHRTPAGPEPSLPGEQIQPEEQIQPDEQIQPEIEPEPTEDPGIAAAVADVNELADLAQRLAAAARMESETTPKDEREPTTSTAGPLQPTIFEIAGSRVRVHDDRIDRRPGPLRLSPSQAVALAKDGPEALRQPRPRGA